jgi:hypothetical protein
MIFVFGNGLSIGFDPRLATLAITDRVKTSLGAAYTDVLRDLAALGAPEDPVPLGVDRGGFEQLAGPVDRLADALIAVQRLFIGPGTSPLLAKLRDAADGLRQHHVRIVGTVLREVDNYCVMQEADVGRRESWERMNAFAAELVRLRATIFTLNYDSLLMSAMLAQTPWVYDGFRSGFLNVPLDPWGNPTLYQLHGSVAWQRAVDGSVSKRKLEAVREEKLLEVWAAGEADHGFPAVILTDLKTRYTEQYPFSMFYDELHRELAREDLVVVGGYSFGDRPLNLALARFLAQKSQNRLIVWNPSGTTEEYLSRLRNQLPQDQLISAHQVSVEHVRLPDADALQAVH